MTAIAFLSLLWDLLPLSCSTDKIIPATAVAETSGYSIFCEFLYNYSLLIAVTIMNHINDNDHRFNNYYGPRPGGPAYVYLITLHKFFLIYKL